MSGCLYADPLHEVQLPRAVQVQDRFKVPRRSVRKKTVHRLHRKFVKLISEHLGYWLQNAVQLFVKQKYLVNRAVQVPRRSAAKKVHIIRAVQKIWQTDFGTFRLLAFECSTASCNFYSFDYFPLFTCRKRIRCLPEYIYHKFRALLCASCSRGGDPTFNHLGMLDK